MLKALVIGRKMNKTAVVVISRKVKHKKYVKYVERITKLFVHDPTNKCVVNDVIFIKKSKPFSKKKHWLFVNKEQKELF